MLGLNVPVQRHTCSKVNNEDAVDDDVLEDKIRLDSRRHHAGLVDLAVGSSVGGSVNGSEGGSVNGSEGASNTIHIPMPSMDMSMLVWV